MIRRALTMGVAAVVATPFVVSALAVQTDTFGIAPTDGSALIKVRPGHTTTRSVTVINRTDHSLRIDLQAISASRDDKGDYGLGNPGQGLAAVIRLGRSSVTLDGGGHTEVAVEVKAPALPDPDFAAVTAVVHGDGSAGFRTRLSVLVEATHTAPVASSGGITIGGTHLATPLVALAIALIVVLGVGIFVLLRRRREEPSPAQ